MCHDLTNGFQSDSVEEQFGSINDCGASLGGSNLMCHDLTNGFQCDTGFAVADTSVCVRDRSFSAISTCHPSMIVLASLGSNGRCVDSISVYSCACEDGFEETQSNSVEEQFGSIND